MTQIGYDVQEAADLYWVESGHKNWKNGATTHQQDAASAFAAGAAWQKERMPVVQAESDVGDRLPPNAGGYRLHLSGKGPHELFSFGNPDALRALRDLFATRVEPEGDGPADAFQNEMRIAIGTLGEGIAEMLKRQGDLQAAGLRGADRGVAILAGLKEIAENVQMIMKQSGDHGAAIGKMWSDLGEKVGVVLDAVRHVGETTQAVLDQVTAIDVVNIEVAREDEQDAYTTEPMHAKVKAADYDESGLGKLWADVTVNLEDVSDETLHELSMSGQIPLPRYVEERARRVAAKIDLGEALAPRVDTDKIGVDPAHGADAMAFAFMRDGKKLGTIKDLGPTSEVFQAWSSGTGLILVAYRGGLYTLSGRQLIPVEIVA